MTPAARFLVVRGPQCGLEFALDKDEVHIGRESSNDIEIRDRSVSRQHCVVRRVASGFLLVSAASTNGTRVNGLPVEERILQDDDEVCIGETCLQFRVQLAEPSLVPVDAGELSLQATTRLLSDSDSEATHEKRALRALYQLSRALSGESTRAQVERVFVEAARDATGAHRLAFLQRGAEGSWVSCVAYDESGWRSAAFPISRTILEQMTSEHEPLLVRDVTEKFPSSDSLRSGGVRSLMTVPVRVHSKDYGVLYLDSFMAAFTADHLEWLVSAAGIVAIALTHTERLLSLQEENRRLRGEVQPHYNLVGNSAAMQQVYQKIARIAPTDSTVLILGESGTGKELVARALHDNSQRSRQPFVVVNCTLLNESLLESDLFGHERGAFTGAIQQKKGKLELANGGTLFLDELGELPETIQAKLLRVLQERQFERLGGNHPIKVDLRILAATHRDLKEAVKAGKFREDLYFRLNVISLAMPALRARREDIAALAEHFLQRCARNARRRVDGIETEAMNVLLRHNWPGNVRELQNVLEHALVMGDDPLVRVSDLPEGLMESDPAEPPDGAAYYRELNLAKQRILQDALQAAGGNYSQAANALGINRTYLHRLMRNLQVKA